MATPSRLEHIHETLGVVCLNIAHRGARGHPPENTLPAFELALKLGAHMFELDVHLTTDEQVVVHHDDDVLRCSDAAQRYPNRASYFISDFRLSELQTLDAGSWLAGAARARIPTLDEALELARAHQRFVNIELKSLPRMYRQLVARVFECLDRLDMREHVLISSFDHQALLDVRARCERVATAALSSDRLASVPEYLDLLDADAYHPSCDGLGLRAAVPELDVHTIDAVRDSGKHINVWTCNDAASMRKLIAAGVTGIVTDYPDRLAPLL
ncbi:MAG TPA: glycerophosphodiester phosphodiesterase family protein [Polyangiales bacterium]|nr:glycerophosphodiester phosphodiesterase family protein [Polyangiales bacterium]